MHFFIQQAKNHKSVQQPFSEHKEEPQNTQQHEEMQQKVIRKIVVKKKPQLKMSNLNDYIIETESQDYVQIDNIKKSSDLLAVPEHKRNKAQGPFMSFMASDRQSQEIQMSTPFLSADPQTSSNDAKSERDRSDSNEKRSLSSNHEKNRARTLSRQLQPNTFQSPNPKNLNQNTQKSLIRQNSMRTEFETLVHDKKLMKYPTEISLEEEVHSEYEQQNEEKEHKPTHGKRKQIKISVLDKMNGEQVNNLTSPPYIYRPGEYFQFSNKNSQQLEEIPDKQQHIEQPNLHSEQVPTLSISNYNQPQTINSSRSASHQSTQRSNVQQKLTLTPAPSTTYQSYIQLQSQQLQHQRQRMNYYANQANKLLCNADTYEISQTHMEVIVDQHFIPLKHIIQELVELYAIGEVIKYKLKYRSYEILTKIFAAASDYYQEKIRLEEPIKAYTFSLAIKALLTQYQKSQLDIVVTKIFHSSQLLSYDEFILQFNSVLNSKLVILLEPDAMKKQVDKTLQKIKNLFVIWIESEYYTKKVKEILRSSKVVYDSIISECVSFEEPHKFDIELLEKFFLQGERKNPMKKIKLDIFFRGLIGNDLTLAKWTEWINKDEMRLYNRYESKLMYERKQYERKLQRKEQKKESIIFQRTQHSIVSTRRKMKINLEENHLSKRTYQNRAMY